MSTVPEILTIFGHEGQAAADITYVNWHIMARAGMAALEFYTPPHGESPGKWRQAHMQARFAILQTFLKASEGNGFVTLSTEEVDGVESIVVKLDRDQIQSVGVPAIREFLLRIQVAKATADFDGAFKFYAGDSGATAVNAKFVALRAEVLAMKKPRRQLVQANTVIDPKTGKVELKEYEPSKAGMIESFVARFGDRLGLMDF